MDLKNALIYNANDLIHFFYITTRVFNVTTSTQLQTTITMVIYKFVILK